MPLRWRSRPRFDGMAAGERSLAGHEGTFNKTRTRTSGRPCCNLKRPFGERCIWLGESASVPIRSGRSVPQVDNDTAQFEADGRPSASENLFNEPCKIGGFK